MPRFPTLSLKYKLPAIIVGFCLVVAAVLQAYVFHEQSKLALEWAKQQFHSATLQRHDRIHEWLDQMTDDVHALAVNPNTRSAIERLGTSYTGIPTDPVEALQSVYITGNPNPPDQREQMVEYQGPLSYFRQHSVFHRPSAS